MTVATVSVEWVKALAPLGAAVVQLGAAVVVAYAGFRYGLRKTREERGFDRRMAWYEETLAASRALREAVNHAVAAETVRRAQAAAAPADFCAMGAPGAEVSRPAWEVALARADAHFVVLDRAVTHADGESEAAAARALVTLRSLAGSFTPYTSIHEPNASLQRNPYHYQAPGVSGGLLPGLWAELRAVESAATAGARAALGYPPRLPELVPNAQGVIEIPNGDTNRTPHIRTLLRRIGLARS